MKVQIYGEIFISPLFVMTLVEAILVLNTHILPIDNSYLANLH
jgi:hypothetical protein